MSAKIISAFPCCGKSCLQDSCNDLKVLYNKTSTFRWAVRHYTEDELDEMRKLWNNSPHMLSTEAYIEKIKNQKFTLKALDFPNNYLQNIKNNLELYDYILVDSHEWITKLLEHNHLDYILVYPERKCKFEWIGRMYSEETPNTLIKIINDNWDMLLDKLDKLSETHKSIKLDYGQYLSDVIYKL